MESLFVVIFIAGVLLVYARFLEPLWIETSRYSIDFDNLPVEKLKILQLSDLHLKKKDWLERLKMNCIEKQIRELGGEFDLILLTGDLIENNGGISVVGELIERLPRSRLGIYACPGNHDYFEYGLGQSIFTRKDPARSLTCPGNNRQVCSTTGKPKLLSAGEPARAHRCASTADLKLFAWRQSERLELRFDQVFQLDHESGMPVERLEINRLTALCASKINDLCGVIG